MIGKKYKRNSALLAARSVIRRSIKLLTNKKEATKSCASTNQKRFHQDCIQNKKMFQHSSKTPLKSVIVQKSSKFQTPKQDSKKMMNQDKVHKTLPTKLHNLRNPVTASKTNVKLAVATPKTSKETLSRLQDKNSKTVNVMARTPSTRSRLLHQHQEQSPKVIAQTMKKTPSLANALLSRQLFAKNSQSTSKLANSITSRLAGSARRSLGFLKKACSTSSLNKFGSSRIPRPVQTHQSSNLVINKTKNETEVFKQVAEILNNSDAADCVVEMPIQALKILYDTPNRDKILKSLKQQTPVVSTAIEIEEDSQAAAEPVVLIDDDLMRFASIVKDNQNNGMEIELANQNQIEIVNKNEIIINKTPMSIKENEKRMFKLINDQHNHHRNSILNKTSEIISPFAMNSMFKSQQPRHIEALTPNGQKRTFKLKTKNGENITPYGMKNLFKQHRDEISVNQVMSPYAMKNLFKRHQENIEPENSTAASPFTMKNLFKEHQKKELSEIAATPFTMKNLYKQHNQMNENVGDSQATPCTMKNLFKKDPLQNSETLSPIALKSLFRNKILNRHHLMSMNVEETANLATPLSMKNLFKIHNKKQAMLNSQDVLSPTVFNCIFEENEAKNSPNKKVEIMCDKLMNNENDVKDELLKVDNCVLINHIIELKQQVRALENFSEQIIQSIDETIEEIDDQMSVQYPDEIEVEEVILSVDSIEETPEVDEVVEEEKVASYGMLQEEQINENPSHSIETPVNEVIEEYGKEEEQINEEDSQQSVDSIEETAEVDEVIEENDDEEEKVASNGTLQEEQINEEDSQLSVDSIEESPEVNEVTEEEVSSNDLLQKEQINEDPSQSVETPVNEVIEEYGKEEEQINEEDSQQSVDSIEESPVVNEFIEKEVASNDLLQKEQINEDPSQSVETPSVNEIFEHKDDQQIETEEEQNVATNEVDSLHQEQINEVLIQEVHQQPEENLNYIKKKENDDEIEIVSEVVVAETIINAQQIFEVVNEAVNDVEIDDTTNVEVKTKRGRRKVVESKQIVKKPATKEEDEIVIEEVKEMRGRKAVATAKVDLIEEQPVDLVDSKKVMRKGTRGKKADEEPKPSNKNDEKTTEDKEVVETKKPAGRRGRKKAEEVKESNSIQLQEILDIEPVVEVKASKQPRTKRGVKKIAFDVEDTLKAEEEPKPSYKNDEKTTEEEVVETKKPAGRRGRKKAEEVKESNSIQLQDILDIEPVVEVKASKQSRTKRGDKKVAFDVEETLKAEEEQEEEVKVRGRRKANLVEKPFDEEVVKKQVGRRRKNVETETVTSSPEVIEKPQDKRTTKSSKKQEESVVPSKKSSKRKVTPDEDNDEDNEAKATTSQTRTRRGVNKKAKL